MPDKARREHRALVAFGQRLIERRTAARNHIRATVQAQGALLPPGHRAWTAAARAAWSQSLARPLEQCGPEALWRGVRHVELAVLETLETQSEQVDQRLDALAKNDAAIRLLETIEGVGTRTAEAVVADLADPRRFRNARQVSAYAGMVPRQFPSGTIDRKGRITKRGPGYLRKILVPCAWLMRRYNAWGAALFERISRGQKKRRKAAAVALGRKLLVRCWGMLKTGRPWKIPRSRS
jgi:transposase